MAARSLARASGAVSRAGPFALVSAGGSDVGAVRQVNEDSWIDRTDAGFWAVADGMGGHQAGDLASQTIVHELAKVSASANFPHLLASVQNAILHANQALREEAAQRGPQTVIGATVVALVTHGNMFDCLWAGDSRLYRLRAGVLAQLTRDHSHVQELVDAGVITAEEAERHPMSNVITRAVGTADALQLDRVTNGLAAGDIFLVCTDGLSKVVPDEEIAGILGRTALDGQPAALIDAALAHGGNDNVTVIVVQVCPQ